jgi:hypothetical protein
MHIPKMIGAALVVAVGGWLGSAGSSHAFTWAACVGFAPDATGKLTTNVGCNVNSDGSAANPSDDDFDGLFGVNDWEEIAKEESSTGGANLNKSGVTFLSTSATANFSGTWSITQALLNKYAHVAIVMKDGNSLPQPTVAYKISSTSGIWETPWAKLKDGVYEPLNSLSNVRFIGQGVGVIPLPAGAWLVLSFMAGFGVLRRIKGRAAA